jgi:hypothetical protein
MVTLLVYNLGFILVHTLIAFALVWSSSRKKPHLIELRISNGYKSFSRKPIFEALSSMCPISIIYAKLNKPSAFKFVFLFLLIWLSCFLIFTALQVATVVLHIPNHNSLEASYGLLTAVGSYFLGTKILLPALARGKVQEGNSTRTRIATWSLFLAATVLYFFCGSFFEAAQLGYYFGQGLVYFLLLAIVLGLVGRKKPPEFKAILTLVGTVIYAGFLLFVVVHLNSKKIEIEFEAAKNEIRELAQTGRGVINAQQAIVDKIVAETPVIVPEQQQANIAPAPSTLPRRSTPPASSMQELFQRLNEIVKQLSTRAIADQAKITSEMEKLGLETTFLPQTLTSKVGIEQNRAKIRAYSKLLERSMALSRSAMSEMEQQVTNLVAGRPDEAKFLRGYAKGKKNRTELEAKNYGSLGIAVKTRPGSTPLPIFSTA